MSCNAAKLVIRNLAHAPVTSADRDVVNAHAASTSEFPRSVRRPDASSQLDQAISSRAAYRTLGPRTQVLSESRIVSRAVLIFVLGIGAIAWRHTQAAPPSRSSDSIFDDAKPGTPDAPAAPSPPARRPAPAPPRDAPADAAATPPARAPRESTASEASPPASRLPQPDAAAQATARGLLHQVFRSEYDKARVPADHVALAEKLLAAEQETRDPVERYVLARESIDQFARGADLTAADRGIAQLDLAYVVDAAALRSATTAAAIKSASTPEAAAAVAQSLLLASRAACDAGDTDAATRAATDAEALARRARDPALLAQARAAGADALRRAQDTATARLASAKLKGAPADPEANLAVGRYYAFSRGAWDRALPYLSKGSDAALRSLATKDLALLAAPHAPSGADAAAMADDWYAAAGRQPGASRAAMLGRCRYWYASAAEGVSGLSRISIERRLAEARTATLVPGLIADVYDGTDFLRFKRTRVDAQIDYHWEAGKLPDPTVGIERFSIAWTGWIKAPHAGAYVLASEADDAMWLALDGKVVIDEFHPYGEQQYRRTVELSGDPQRFTCLYGQVTGKAFCHIKWQPPGGKMAPIPASAFFHDPVDAAGEAPTIALEPMPSDAVVGPGGHRYRLFTERLTWQAAQRQCRWMGGRLACPKAQPASDFLNDLVRGSNDNAWIGLTDDGHEGDWRWADGEKVTYEGWGDNEPNGGTKENYGVVAKEGNGWRDWNKYRYYICEWDGTR